MPRKKVTYVGTFWRWLTNVWTVLLFLAILDDFFKNGALDNVVGPIAAIYVGALAIFSAEKEFERWQFYKVGRHPGEIYVAMWTLLIAGIMIYVALTGSSYRISPDILSTYIAVLAILAVTRRSKTAFREKNEGN